MKNAKWDKEDGLFSPRDCYNSHISKHKLNKCEVCGSEDIDYITKIIGYRKRISKFSEPRQKEAEKRN